MRVAVGIDLGGTNVKGIVLDEVGTILHRHSIPTNDDNYGNWREKVLEMVNYLKNSHGKEVDVIGMSCPGLANAQNTCISHMPGRLPGLENFYWESFFNTRTFVLNDAHAALIAEAKFGEIQGYRNAVLLTLGTGVGGGILINGELYQGEGQMAGHFGHISINSHDDELSVTGMPGSLEYAIGNYSIQRRSLGRYTSTLDLVKAYNDKDHFATWLWLDLVRKLSLTIASFANSLSPQIVVLAGGITQAGNALLEPLQQFISMYEWRPNKKTMLVKLARFNDLSGAIGAAAFALTKI
ncbi:MAG: ROK family protein [Chitinophagaceae bacterium]